MDIVFGALTRKGHPDDSGLSVFFRTVSSVLSLTGPSVYLRGGFGIATHGMSPGDRFRESGIFHDEDRKILVALNGDIVNRRELQQELRDRRASWPGEPRSAPELAFRMYETYGIDFVSRLDAISNIAIWHDEEERLLLIPDPFGLRPFYYFHDGNAFVFASSIKAVLLHPSVSRAVEPDVLYELLELGFVLPPDTMFRGLKIVPPGEYLDIAGAPLARPLASRRFQPPQDFEEDRKAGEYFELFRNAVAARTDGAERVAVLLSGGVDSSAIVGVLSTSGGKTIDTYTMHVDSNDTEELEAARDVSKRFGTRHAALTELDAASLDTLPEIIWQLEVPHVDVVAESALCKSIDRAPDVVLTGNGNDIPWGLLSPSFLERSNKNIAELYLLLRRKMAEDTVKGLLLDQREAGFLLSDKIARFSPDAGSLFRKLIFLDRKLFGAHFVNRLIGKLRIENQELAFRFPYLDKRIIDFVARLPESAMVRCSDSGRMIWKWLFKKAMERHDMLPARIIHRKKRWMYHPTAEWLRGGDIAPVERLVLGKGNRLGQYFDIGPLKKLWEDHRGRRSDNSHALETMLSFEVWHRIFIDSRGCERPRVPLKEML